MIDQKRLQQARNYAAGLQRDIATNCFDDDFGFAAHVTDADKQLYRDKCIKLAEQIETGLLDDKFHVWQPMNYFLTGELVPFLPKYNDKSR